MTDAIGPGSHVVFVGYPGHTDESVGLCQGTIYTVTHVVEMAPCSVCSGGVGLHLSEATAEPPVLLEHFPNWRETYDDWGYCSCGFRPVGGDSSAAVKELRRHMHDHPPAERVPVRTPEEVA